MSATTEVTAIHEDVVQPHEDHKNPERFIAIALDASKNSEYAFDWAIKNLIRAETDQIILINVRPAVTLPVVYGPVYVDLTKESEALEAANREASHELLRSYAAKLPAHKYNIRGVALRGDPRDEISAKVAELKVDMLVIGSRGLGGFKKALLGSVSDYLIHHLTVPVIVSRPPEIEA
ncbi:adenine nucleotide alpha hydrolases-like protein [Rhizoclosmatium globosum]|uniref:Adenine nucleotide alpha hydrolases-like protein n=1 Tax=Rhizoclosmatium globosum TaxID=329046 RepID=A0A1Y2CY56_9FUNG|nr:adenine nucleotide alpha hydrolases-like protein [Rhizoclosmatium globosum]|eukprot:ORY51962.1 adenine nucleotide alpha hydrolases-like protein [Rhizoclosmatium globosum]